MFVRIRRWCYVLTCGVFLCLGVAGEVAIAQPVEPIREPLAWVIAKSDRGFFAGILRQHGYSSETPEQLKEAAKKGSVVRRAAINLLAARLRKEAIPLLKEALEDPDVRVRIDATSLLGAFGDGSGIPVLRKDLATFAPLNGLPDPNMKDLQGEELERAKQWWRHRLRYAIQAAEALSELKDASGLELAARTALTTEYAGRRQIAFRVLTNLALCDKSVLAGQTIDPLSVLIAAAGAETNRGLLSALKAAAARLPDSKAKLLYEKLIASPHITDEDRTIIQGRIKAIE
jgi:hypothetical protein